MTKTIVVMALVALVPGRLIAQDWHVEVPEGVRYIETTPTQRQEVLTALHRAFSEGGDRFRSLVVADVLVAGPALWNDLGVACPVKEPPAKQVFFQVDLRGVTLLLEAKRFLPEEAPRLLDALNDYTSGQEFAIRPPTTEELIQFWRFVPYDLEAPIVVLDSEKFSFLLDFQGGSTLGLIEQLRPGFGGLFESQPN